MRLRVQTLAVANLTYRNSVIPASLICSQHIELHWWVSDNAVHPQWPHGDMSGCARKILVNLQDKQLLVDAVVPLKCPRHTEMRTADRERAGLVALPSASGYLYSW